MSGNWTDYAENQFVDMTRGTAPTLPASLWYIGLLSIAADSGVTELTGANLARKSIGRSLAAWAGTQGAGTTTASSGTSHQTSNNADVQFLAASADLAAAANYYGIFDAASSGNCWAYIPIGTPLVVHSGDAPSVPAGTLAIVLGEGNGCSDYLSNKLIDLWLRGQAFSWPANTYEALFTAAPGNSGGGTEVSGGSYARVGVASSTAAWSGTQSAGSTGASSGTSGETSNNAPITFPAPTADWGTLQALGYYDASSAGNLLGWGLFDAPRSIQSGAGAPGYAAGARKRRFL